MIISIFLATLAFLAKDNSGFVYPHILYLFASFLLLNLAASLSLSRWPSREGLAAAAISANCAVITGILIYSGGRESTLWVLYLLPIYSVCLLLRNREVAFITAGVVALNGMLYVDASWAATFSGINIFDFSVRSGTFLLAAALTWRIARRERLARARVDEQRKKIDALERDAVPAGARLQRLETMADVGHLASGVAHDLNNPFTVIGCTVKILLEETGDDHPYSRDLKRILRSTELGHTIVDNLLNLTKAAKFEVEPASARELLEATLEMYEQTLARNRIKVERKFDGDDPRIAVNRPQFQRVLLNLISNARSVMAEGGTLTLRTELVRSSQPGARGRVLLVVEDTGPGIREEMFDMMFKPFNSTKSKAEGTGLGLYLSREIVKEHGGSLWGENRSRGGARFVIALPEERRSVASVERTQPVAAAGRPLHARDALERSA